MIRVKVDIVPYGIEEGATQIGELLLANVASIGMGKCEYDAVIQYPHNEKQYKTVTHHRQNGFWELIRLILNAEDAEKITPTMERLAEKISVGE